METQVSCFFCPTETFPRDMIILDVYNHMKIKASSLYTTICPITMDCYSSPLPCLAHFFLSSPIDHLLLTLRTRFFYRYHQHYMANSLDLLHPCCRIFVREKFSRSIKSVRILNFLSYGSEGGVCESRWQIWPLIDDGRYECRRDGRKDQITHMCRGMRKLLHR